MKRFFLLSLCALCCLCACKSGGKGGRRLLPNISGKAGEVLVVCDRYQWDMTLKSVVTESLCDDCPWLAQKEPLYDVISTTPSNFGQMFQIHRNIIVFNVNAEVNAPGVSYAYDRWAQPQIVITVNAADPEQAAELFNGNSDKIIAAIEQKERDRIIVNTRQYQQRELAAAVDQFIGGEMVFPSGYGLKKRTENFMWISYETVKVQQGFFIYSYPATGKADQLSLESLVEQRNKVLKAEVPGPSDGSYMTTGTFLAPSVKYAGYKGIKFAELRGLWEVENDFMGGPFVSHTFYTPDGLNLVCIEAYVFAPSKNKRHYLRQVESLLYGFQWPEEEKPEEEK